MTAQEALEQIKLFFDQHPPGTQPVRLDECTTIESPAVFVHAHILFCDQHVGKAIAQPYMARLWKLKTIMEEAEKAKFEAAYKEAPIMPRTGKQPGEITNSLSGMTGHWETKNTGTQAQLF